MSNSRTESIELEQITGCRWVDEDGTVYQRTMDDGEIVDKVVGHE
jgi:hypothetical protein